MSASLNKLRVEKMEEEKIEEEEKEKEWVGLLSGLEEVGKLTIVLFAL